MKTQNEIRIPVTDSALEVALRENATIADIAAALDAEKCTLPGFRFAEAIVAREMANAQARGSRHVFRVAREAGYDLAKVLSVSSVGDGQGGLVMILTLGAEDEA